MDYHRLLRVLLLMAGITACYLLLPDYGIIQ